MTTGTKEFYDIMSQFERDMPRMNFRVCSLRFEKEEKSLWSKGHFYENGEVNNLFIGYMAGYSCAKSVFNQTSIITHDNNS